MFEVLILNAKPEASRQPVLYEGTSRSVILPGSEGEFEVLDFHKPVLSRLKKGDIVVDNNKEISIRGGVMSMLKQKLVIIAEI